MNISMLSQTLRILSFGIVSIGIFAGGLSALSVIYPLFQSPQGIAQAYTVQKNSGDSLSSAKKVILANQFIAEGKSSLKIDNFKGDTLWLANKNLRSPTADVGTFTQIPMGYLWHIGKTDRSLTLDFEMQSLARLPIHQLTTLESRQLEKSMTALGSFFVGSFALIIVASIGFAVILRKRTSYLYFFWVMATFLFAINSAGFFNYWFPTLAFQPTGLTVKHLIYGTWVLTTALLFSDIVGKRIRPKSLRLLLRLPVYSGIFLCLIAPLTSGQQFIIPFWILSGIDLLILTVGLCYALKTQPRLSTFLYFCGWAAMIVAMAVELLRAIGILPHVISAIFLPSIVVSWMFAFTALFERSLVSNLLTRRLRRQVAASTERRDALEDTLKTRAKFLSSAVHDLHQPLQSMRMQLELLLPKLNEVQSEPLQTHIQQIHQAQLMMCDTLGSVTDIAHIQNDNYVCLCEPVSADEVLFQVNAYALTKAGASSALYSTNTGELDAELMLITNPVILIRVLRNLLDNAINYSFRLNRQAKVSLNATIHGSRIEFRVTDNGVGISKENQALIWSEFVRVGSAQSEIPGTGLGLAFVQDAMKRMAHHNISMTSMEHEGTEFVLSLPIKYEQLVIESDA